MNIRTYITLGLIGLSASGIQGMGCRQHIQSYWPQITQKLRPYHYHIGGTLVLAGLLYGGYRAYQAWRNSCNSCQQASRNPCEIIYEFNRKRSRAIPNNINIKHILCDGKQLTREEVGQNYWNTENGTRALNNFTQGVRTLPIRNNDQVRFTYGHHVCTVDKWYQNTDADIHEIARSLLIPHYALTQPESLLSFIECCLK